MFLLREPMAILPSVSMRSGQIVSPGDRHSYFFETVTDAVAVLVGSAADVALTVTVDGDGTELGARYNPAWLIVPTVELPPVMPLTFHVADVFAVP